MRACEKTYGTTQKWHLSVKKAYGTTQNWHMNVHEKDIWDSTKLAHEQLLFIIPKKFWKQCLAFCHVNFLLPNKKKKMITKGKKGKKKKKAFLVYLPLLWLEDAQLLVRLLQLLPCWCLNRWSTLPKQRPPLHMLGEVIVVSFHLLIKIALQWPLLLGVVRLLTCLDSCDFFIKKNGVRMWTSFTYHFGFCYLLPKTLVFFLKKEKKILIESFLVKSTAFLEKTKW